MNRPVQSGSRAAQGLLWERMHKHTIVSLPEKSLVLCLFFFFLVLGLKLRAYTLNHSTSSFL
jgi:hypothetical protein